MKTLKTLIVEDQADIRRDIRAMLRDHPLVDIIGESGTVKDALEQVKDGQPDLMLLDVQLEKQTAFDLLKAMGTVTCKVIFLTAYEKYAIQAIKYGALDYLLKPIDKEELLSVINKVSLSNAGERGHNFIVLSSTDYLQIVKLDDIMYCHSDSGYTTFYLSNGKKVLTSQHLKWYEDILPSNKFIKPHRSYLVNYEYIDRYQKLGEGNLILKDGTAIPVSARKRDEVMRFFKGLNAR